MKKKIFFVLHLLILVFSQIYANSLVSTGTGFFVSGDGLIVTCAHVIENADRVSVKIGNEEYTAQIIFIDTSSDLAILRINHRNPHHFRIANFENVNLGDKILVLGFPLSDILGADIRLTDGIVSARSGINADQTYFQVSAPIQPGNSGGPIFNERFEVVGVAAHKLNDMSTLAAAGVIPQNINFGVKANHVRTLTRNIVLGAGNVISMNDAINATVHVFTYEATERAGSIIHIANKTGYTVFYIYVSPATSNSWGADRLGSNVLLSGQSFTVSSLDLSRSNIYDIKLIDEDNDTYTIRDILLSGGQTIEFTLRNIDGVSAPNTPTSQNSTITIVNRTGYVTWYAYVSPNSSSSWGIDLLGEDVLMNGDEVRVFLPENTNNQFDIRLIDSDGDSYTKSNINVSAGQTIIFTISDID